MQPAQAVGGRRGRAAASLIAGAAALALLACAASLLPGAAAQKEPPNPLPCLCTDVDVRESFISIVNFTCWEQYTFGKCNESFIFDAIKEVPEGYCEISCGRCACCPTLAAAAAAAGLSEFLWAMNATAGGRGIFLNSPGFEATVMAPDDGAMRALFDGLGGKARIASDTAVRDKLGAITAYHVVKPLPGYEAWTSPFFAASGASLATFAPGGSNLSIAESGSSGGGAIKVQGGGSSADIITKDIYACKGYINKLNWYLMPPGERLSS